MNKPEELWSIAVNEGLNNYDRNGQPEIQTLFLVGASKSGKTTLIHAFLDKDDEPKVSLPVEYTYIRRTNKYMVKDICYIWEVDTANINLVHVHDLWNACERIEELKKNLEAKPKTIITFGILGMKYDLFEVLEIYSNFFTFKPILNPSGVIMKKNLSTEKKLILCRIAKHYATIVDGHLVFCTRKDRTTMKVAKDLFSHLAFKTKFSHPLRFDLSSPVIIPKGGENKSDINYLHNTFEIQFAHLPVTSKMDDDDPAKDASYANEAIDKERKKYLEKIEKAP
ncbi:cytoplasmic dynein 2 light intermediate chain 1 isoform X2 [Daphnia magna]|uniref:cytoplasmic dynein 2 light intermediate chain 1 isoform X2 n=1 Tax=Daphnia magna TaxID=35525 RepID=UPI001E1BB027|nr:cytoplasmic dynein 2 light intermediate chain 1 isoform X2 [Daphnia magna]